jgi:hypothetical protein
MKHFKTLLACGLVILLIGLVGCRDEAATSFTGGYVYKTGGQLKVLPTVLTGDSVDAVAACSTLSGYDLSNLWAPLTPESGEMTMVYTNEAKDSVILTFTALLGDLCTLRGTLTGDTLTLSGTDTKSMQLTDGSQSLGGGFVTVSGEGRMYNNMLILDLRYEGAFNSTTMGRSTEMTIVDNRIQCVAQTFSYLGLDVYAYKTGGQVRLMPTVLTDSTVTAVDACSELCGYDLHDLWLPLKPESGALNITGPDTDGSVLTLSFNALLGDICTMRATQNDERLVLTGDNSKTMQLTDGEQSLGGGVVNVTGSGKRTDNQLLLDLDYTGTFTSTVTGRAVEMTILDSKVQCSATKNEK